MPSCVLFVASFYIGPDAKNRKGWGMNFGGEWPGMVGEAEICLTEAFPVRYPTGDGGKRNTLAYKILGGDA